MEAAVVMMLLFVPIFGVAIAGFIWWLIVLIEAVKVPSEAWRAAGQEQILHILLMVFLGVIGTIIYVVTARPALRAVGAQV